ncbi:purine-cytosine permease family protein [Actinomadura rupiterrae]|uniref:purine-cytosine permease family protein n=1 Tax=Actinomadura rupiterrae TaxID=559627 RepID=UPI0020A5EF6E|nr:cytosine permease [Actinomadura rupiterrae]MCP2336521.1 NCS1 family nucleobase:cation symporter-1 [Actinomadura rupiterrae]
MAPEPPPSLLERRTIDVVPESERHGTPLNQFTLWFGANMQITAVVNGALAVVFGADPLWAVVGLLIGNLLGGAVMALHSAQGPRLGLPQMISSRAQFGVFGAVLPLLLVILMYLGFAATGTVLAGQAVDEIVHTDSKPVGIIVFGALTAVVAVLGYRYIHNLGRVATVLGVVGFTYLMIRLASTHDLGGLFGAKPFDAATFLLAISLGAGWQLTFGPYVADYSRYLPRLTSARTTFHCTLWGSVIGSQWSMVFGVLLAALPTASGAGFLDNQVGFMGHLGGSAIAVLIYLVIIVGKLTINTLNAYGGFMSILTTVSAFTSERRVSQWARTLYIAGFLALSVLVALLASHDFLTNFKNFVLLLLTVFTPWSAINLVDYYLVSKERVDIPALYDPNGRYGRWNIVALGCYVVGIVAQIPFLSQTLYTGPVTKMIGGADISWIIGLVLTAALYYPLARPRSQAPDDMIYPDGFLPAAEPQPTG